MSSDFLESGKERATSELVNPNCSWSGWGHLLGGAILAAVVGAWLVWFSAYTQRKFQEEDVRAACHRMMPETAERCFDTVVIQRGGVRR